MEPGDLTKIYEKGKSLCSLFVVLIVLFSFFPTLPPPFKDGEKDGGMVVDAHIQLFHTDTHARTLRSPLK